MSRRNAGLTLIELVIAISLAGLVLAGILSIATSMVKYQLDGMRQGTVTGWAVTSYSRLVKEIADANVLVFPADVQESDFIAVCSNWSRLVGSGGGKLSDSEPVQIFYFCYDFDGKSLNRYYASNAATCPNLLLPPLPPPCPNNISGIEKDVIALNVERSSGQPIFKRVNSIGGVAVRYVVGKQEPDTARPTPIFMRFETSIKMNKQYSNTVD